MKYLKPVLSLLCMLQLAVTMAQTNWVEDRTNYQLSEEELALPLYYLYRGITYDYQYNDEGNLICDIGHHVILRAANDNALESTNKIYIPTGNVIDIFDVRARTISPSGKVLELDQENIKEVKDEEESGGYRIFAVEGAEVGGEIEYTYTMRTYGSTFVWQLLQYEAPMKQLDFTLSCPENLEYEFLIVNDTAQVVQRDTVDSKNVYGVSLQDVPGYKAESFAGDDANKIRVEGKLAYNSYSGGRRLNTFADAGRKIYESAHELTKDESRALTDFLKENRPKDDLDAISKLRHYEHVVKSQFYEEEYAPDDLSYLITNRLAHRRAFLKLFVSILEDLEIDYEIVITIDRSEAQFNPDFDNWKYLDEFLIYLPTQDTFFAPHHMTNRYGSVPPQLTAQKGLFVGAQLITDFSYPVSRIDYIPAATYESNMSNQEITVTFDEDMATNEVEARLTSTGSESEMLKTALLWMTAEQRDEMINERVRYIAPDAEIHEVTIEEENTSFEQWNEPLVFVSKLSTSAYLEQAGPSLLFNLGAVIGIQSELYQEDERQFDVYNVYNRGYDRKITVELPPGYEAQNLDDIRITKEVYDDDQVVYAFRSDYELSGNRLEVTIEEYYNSIFFPKERFEEFRQVINAAADWNKVTLVLRPNG